MCSGAGFSLQPALAGLLGIGTGPKMPAKAGCRLKSALPTVLALLLASAALAQNVITTVAGTDWIFPGDGKPAVEAPIGGFLAMGVATDQDGNFYIADEDNAMVMKVTPDGTVHVIAGNGILGYSGDGGP